MHVLGLMCIYAQNEIFPCTAKRFSTGFAWRALGPFFSFSPRVRDGTTTKMGAATAARSSKEQQTAANSSTKVCKL